MKEGEMYKKVKDFFIKIKGCDDSLAWYTKGEGAKDGVVISINFAGGQIKPDVYGVKTHADNVMIFLAEGKTSIGGHKYDEARGQALAYQKFCHFSYLFFPEREFGKEEMWRIKYECKESGIGLLKVPSDRELRKEDIVIDAKISPYINDNDEFLKRSTSLLSKIRSSFSGKFKDVYPNLIRDFIYLIGNEKYISEQKIFENFITSWGKLKEKGGFQVIDPYRRKVLDKKGINAKRRLIEDLRDTSLLLELIRRSGKNFKLTRHGKILKYLANEDKNNVFTKNFSTAIRNFLATRILNIYHSEIYEILEKLLNFGKPLPWSVIWCYECGFMGWYKKFWNAERKIFICPKCSNENLSKNLYILLDPKNEGKFDGFYSVEKFLDAVGIIKRKTYKQMKNEFSEIEHPPNQNKARRLYYVWIGDFFKSL